MDEFVKEGVILLETMARALVNQPEQVKVSVFEGEQTTVFRVMVGHGDFGQVLGKQGTIAEAMRRVLQGYSAKSRRRAILDLLDPKRDNVVNFR